MQRRNIIACPTEDEMEFILADRQDIRANQLRDYLLRNRRVPESAKTVTREHSELVEQIASNPRAFDLPATYDLFTHVTLMEEAVCGEADIVGVRDANKIMLVEVKLTYVNSPKVLKKVRREARTQLRKNASYLMKRFDIRGIELYNVVRYNGHTSTERVPLNHMYCD